MTATLRLHLLGEFRGDYGGRPVAALDSARLQSLLARLVLHPSVAQPRGQLVFLFWPDSPDARARANLRNLLYGLHVALPDADTFLELAGEDLRSFLQPHEPPG